jgi:23S rRNA (uracil1939-C5)-methyltransferase
MHAPGEVIELEIDSMAFGGRAVGRLDGFVFFVDGALPLERVRAVVEDVKRRHGFARATEILRVSPERIAPACPSFGRCGGCAFLHWSYAGQCAAKTRFVRDALRRFAAAADALPPLAPSATPFAFRNRMGFSVARDPATGRAVAGLHERDSFERIVSASACLLPCPELMRLRARIEETIQGFATPPRRLDLRVSRHTGERMANLSWDTPPAGAEVLTAALEGECEHLFLSFGPEAPDYRQKRRRTRLAGRGVFVERLGGLDFEVGPDTFFQTNTEQADRMFGHVRACVDGLSPRRVVDLYAGVGVVALMLAAPGRTVLGFEASHPSVRAAQRNVQRNGLSGVEVRCAAVEAVRPAHLGFLPDLLVVDPPRAGLSQSALARVLDLRSPNLIYVSCNPSTLGRDIEALSGGGYTVESAMAFDLFPQTAHVESVVLLRR